MHFSKLLGLVAALLATAEALSTQKPRIAPRAHQQKYNLKTLSTAHSVAASSTEIKDMIIQGIVTRSATDSSNGTTVYDDSVSCMLTLLVYFLFTISKFLLTTPPTHQTSI